MYQYNLSYLGYNYNVQDMFIIIYNIQEIQEHTKRSMASIKITESISERQSKVKNTIIPVFLLLRLRVSPESVDSLAGEREHGIPNNTKTEENTVGDTEDILNNIHTENNAQVGVTSLSQYSLVFSVPGY